MKHGYHVTAALTALILAGAALAHGIDADSVGFAAGPAHLFIGQDYLLAMLTVGIGATWRGGRAWQTVFAVFWDSMMIGLLLVWGAVTLSLAETGIIGIVVILGWMIGYSVRLSRAVSVGPVDVFYFFQEQSHGREVPRSAAGIQCGLGLQVSRGVLLATGVRFRRRVMLRDRQVWRRPAGVSLMAAAVMMPIGI